VVGEGTTFTIELDEVAEAAEPHDDGPARPPEPADDPGEQHTVLYVEDNPSNLRLVERVLAERGGVRLLTTDRGERSTDWSAGTGPSSSCSTCTCPTWTARRCCGACWPTHAPPRCRWWSART
jgi:hypothetical protein